MSGPQINSSDSQNIKDLYKISIYYVVFDITERETQEKFKDNDLNLLGPMKNVVVSEKPFNNVIRLVCGTFKWDISKVLL